MKLVFWDVGRVGQLCELWNKEWGEQFPMREALFLQNSFGDPNMLIHGSWIAVDEETDKAVGFISAKVWQEDGEIVLGADVGWIQALLVDRECRGRGVGSTLLAKAEKAFRDRGVQKILLGSDPWHYFPGIPDQFSDAKCWFEQKGYEAANLEHDLVIDLAGKTAELPVLEDGAFRTLASHDKQALLAFLRRCFPGRWEYEAIAYFERGGTGREFVVLEKAGAIVAFCRINASNSPVIAQNVYWAPLFSQGLGGIGPLGVDPRCRKYGYGLAVVAAGMHFHMERGITNIVIDWTTLVEFYAKLGFSVWKSYRRYSKQIDKQQCKQTS